MIEYLLSVLLLAEIDIVKLNVLGKASAEQSFLALLLKEQCSKEEVEDAKPGADNVNAGGERLG